jgi:hypothetical protein
VEQNDAVIVARLHVAALARNDAMNHERQILNIVVFYKMSFYKHYYVKMAKDAPYNKASQDVLNALQDPCAFQNPRPGSNCPPNAYQNAPIKFKNTSTNAAGDWTAEININGDDYMILGTNDNVDIKSYNHRFTAERYNSQYQPNQLNEAAAAVSGDVATFNAQKAAAYAAGDHAAYLKLLGDFRQAFKNTKPPPNGGAKNKKRGTKRRRHCRKASRRSTSKK